MNENGGKYCGLDRYECRKAIVADLEAEGYLVKTEPDSHNVGTCYRGHNDVEPIKMCIRDRGTDGGRGGAAGS